MTDQTIKLQQLEEEKAKNIRDANIRKEDNARKRDEFKHKKNFDYQKLIFDHARGLSSDAMKAVGAMQANDPSWYNQVPELSELAGKVQFTIPSGTLIKEYDSYLSSNGTSAGNEPASNPGILTYDFIPTIGVQDDSNLSPIVAAGQNIFAKIRESISPALPYEAMDVVKLAILLDSAAYMAAYATRTYSFMSETTHTNKYKVNGYLRASMPWASFDQLNSFVYRANDFRLAINKFLQQISFVKIPAEFRVIIRHSWMCANIFSDSAESDSNVHMFIPSVYYVYNQTRGSLEAKSLKNKLTSVEGWVSVFNEIVNTFYNYSDISRISGDCVKTFGLDKCYTFTGISANEIVPVTPIYSLEVLSQICNANVYITSENTDANLDTVASACIWERTAEVTSNNFNYGVLYQSVYPGTQDRVELGVRVVTMGTPTNYMRMYTDNVKPDDVMVATRLMSSVSKSNSLASIASITGDAASLVSLRNITICGSEILVDAKFFYFTVGNNKYPMTYAIGGDFGFNIVVSNNKWNTDSGYNTICNACGRFQVLNYLKAFEWAPRFRFIISLSGPDGPSTGEAFQVIGGSDYDMHKIAEIPDGSLANMHYAAIASLFAGVPIGSKENKSKR